MLTQISEKKRERLLLLLLAALTLLYLSPLWLHPLTVIQNDDYYQRLAMHGHLRVSLSRYLQFPLRTHLFGGGYPIIGDPEDPSLNPLVLLSVIGGEIVGLKLTTIFFYLLGVWGMFRLARDRLEYNADAAFFSATLYALSSWTVHRILSGNIQELYYYLTPAILWLLSKSRTDGRCLLAAAALLYITLATGKLSYPIIVILIALYVLLESLSGEKKGKKRRLHFDPSLAVSFLIIVGLSLVWGLPKIVSVLDLIYRDGSIFDVHLHFRPVHPGIPDVYGAMKPGNLALWLVEPTENNWIYLGPVPVLLFIVAAVVYRRELWRWLLLLLISINFIFAYYSPIDFFAIMKHLPILKLAANTKYFGFFPGFIIALLAGRCFPLPRLNSRQGIGRWMAAAILIAAALPLCSHNYRLLTAAYRGRVTPVSQTSTFYQVVGLDLKRDTMRTLHSNTYLNLLRGVGTIDWYTGMSQRELAHPKYLVTSDDELVANPSYRGEAFFLRDKGDVLEAEFTPNRIAVKVSVSGERGTLVINQNYDRYFKTDVGELRSYQGLLAVDISGPGNFDVELRYRPYPFFIALAVSLLAFGLSVFIFWIRPLRRERLS